MPTQSDMFPPKAAAEVCGVSVSYLAHRRQAADKRRPGLSEGPRFLRLGRNKIVYRRADLEAWLSSHAVDSARRED